MLVNEKIELLQALNRIVRSTDCFRAVAASGHPSLASRKSVKLLGHPLLCARVGRIIPWHAPSGAKEVNFVSGTREIGRPEKEFNFFANFVPPFPENESEAYASEPEIKFLLSRKTSATNQKGGRATHGRGTDARSAA